MKAYIQESRREFHSELITSGVLCVSNTGIASNADSSSKASMAIALDIARQLNAPIGQKLDGQTAGKQFELAVSHYVEKTFPKLQHLRPGTWQVRDLGNKNRISAASFAQYEHLAYLAEVIKADKNLSTMLGNDYVISPDVVVYRELCGDSEINTGNVYVNDDVCTKAALRKKMVASQYCTHPFRQNGL